MTLGLFLVGVFVVAGNVLRGAWRQRYVTAPLLARVITTYQVIAYAAMPLPVWSRAGWDPPSASAAPSPSWPRARAGQRSHPAPPVPRSARPAAVARPTMRSA